MSVEEENKELVKRYYLELMSTGDLSFVDKYFAPEFEFTNPTHQEPYRGDEFKHLVTMLRGAFPDVKFSIEDIIADGDTVVGHWTARGTHCGKPLETIRGDLPAKNLRFEIDGFSWIRIQNGKFVEARINEETLGLLRQIGYMPSPAPLPQATTPEQNAALVDRYFNEAWNQGKVDVLDEIMRENVTHRIPTLSLTLNGLEVNKQFLKDAFAGLSDVKFRVERQIAEGNKVASRWYLEATHTGTFMGLTGTGKAIKDQGIDLFVIVDGKIAQIDTNEDSMGFLRQLGAFGGG